MISFSDYVTQPPNILCGISRDKKYLFEELHAEPYHFIVPKKDTDKYPGDLYDSGVMHVKKFGHPDQWLVPRDHGKDPIAFTDKDAALTHARHIRKQSGKKLDEADRKLSGHYKETQYKYEAPLTMYGKSSTSLNHSLLAGEKPSDQALKLDHALNHRATPDDMVVYSGISSNHAAKVVANDVVHHPSFLSTSLDLNTAATFSHSQGSNHILKIHVPQGHRGAYIGEMNSNNAHEREFLLPRGLKLRFHRDKEQILKRGEGNADIHIHHATIES